MYSTTFYCNMIKIFGVGDESEKSIDSRDIGESQTHDHDEYLDEEIGQIALDILDNGDQIFIVAPIAGIELEDIDIYLNKSTLTLRGNRKKPQELYNDSTDVKNSECFWGKFVRNVILPENLDFSSIKAVMENNLLVVSIPKLRFASQNIKIDRIEN